MTIMYKIPEEFTRPEKLQLLNSAFKVSFVRHPFVRLVSSYQDKAIHMNYSGWRQQCLKFTSKTPLKRNNLPNFDQFVDFVLEKFHKNLHIDVHLMPFWNQCDFCQIDYDVIGKVETSTEDTEYIFNKVKKVFDRM